MWTLWLWMCIIAAVTAGPPELRCVHPRCRDSSNGMYHVEGKTTIIRLQGDNLTLHCNQRTKPDSSALPQFSSPVQVTSVELISCPPPEDTYAKALAAINVTLTCNGSLSLNNLLQYPSLTANHFANLEHIVSLKIEGAEFMIGRSRFPYYHNYYDDDYEYSYGYPYHRTSFRNCFRSPRIISVSKPSPATGFLAPLRHLRSLTLKNLELSDKELEQLPPTLQSVSLSNTGVKSLPVHALPFLKELNLKEEGLEVFQVPELNRMNRNEEIVKMDLVPSLEIIMLTNWAEERPATLDHCDALRKLHFVSPKLKALPEYWVAACSRLVSLRIQGASQLTELPSNLLEGGKSITDLAFVECGLESIPEGLLLSVVNLRSLDLSHNQLHTLPSAMFKGPRALNYLNLSFNRLDTDVQNTLAGLVHLTSLYLGFNKAIGDLCERSGNSRLINLKNLKNFSLLDTNITHICADWRLNMTKLEDLEMRYTKVKTMTFTDFQFTRDYNNCTVSLLFTPWTTIQVTEEDYQAALEAPETGAWIQPNIDFLCNCDMFWAWKVLKEAKHTIKTILRCRDGRMLDELSASELCPAMKSLD